MVRVCPGSAARAGGAQEAQAIVKDNSDGSYTATYSVEARGDYEVLISVTPSAKSQCHPFSASEAHTHVQWSLFWGCCTELGKPLCGRAAGSLRDRRPSNTVPVKPNSPCTGSLP